MIRLKVYGLTLRVSESPAEANNNRQRRCVVAAQNQQKAASALGVSSWYLREHGCETGNKREIGVALADPGRVFWEYKGTWTPLDRPAGGRS